MKGDFLMPLTLADIGEEYIITRIGGNVIVNVKGSRVAISKEMAQKIMV